MRSNLSIIPFASVSVPSAIGSIHFQRAAAAQLADELEDVLQGDLALHLEFLDDRIGNLEPGKEADFIILDPCATDLSARRLADTQSPDEILFALTMLADERNIHATYLQGQRYGSVPNA